MSDQTVCVLFANIAGSDRLQDRLGDTEALRASERCLNRMERGIAAHKGGRLLKMADHGLVAAFETAEAGVLAAVDMHQRVDALPPVSGSSLAIQVGLHLGDMQEEAGQMGGEAVNVAARLVNLARAGQTLVTAEMVAALPESMQAQLREFEGLPKAGDNPVRLFEVLWERGESLTLPSPIPVAPIFQAETRLRLRHGTRETILGADRPTATLGRDSHADIVTRDSRASRTHGRIERRRDKFVLVDQSTNGTYVTFEGEAEFALKREEVVLRGRGSISFGHTNDMEGVERLEFEVLG